MPIPSFIYQTATASPDPDAPDKPPFAMIGTQGLIHLRQFGARDWFVFSVLLLRSDKDGFVDDVPLPTLQADLDNMNRETLQAAIKSLCVLRVGGRRVLRKVSGGQFGANQYVLFPDRPDAPLAGVPEASLPAPAPKKRRGRKPGTAMPRRAPVAAPASSAEPEPLVFPVGWAGGDALALDDSALADSSGKNMLLNNGDARDPEPEPGPVSSGNNPLLSPVPVAEIIRYLDPFLVADYFRYSLRNNTGIGEEVTGETYTEPAAPYAVTLSLSVPALDRQNPVKNVSKPVSTVRKPSPPARDTLNPKCAADCVALFLELYQARYNREPIGDRARLGGLLARTIKGGTPAQEIAAVIRYYFAPGHGNAASYGRKEHSMNWFVYKFAEIAAYGSGRQQEAIGLQRAAASERERLERDRLRAEAEAEGGDFLPPHLQAICDTDEPGDGDPYAHLFTNADARDLSEADTIGV